MNALAPARAAAILVAGGRGNRFGGYKQLAELTGRSVLSRSLEVLQRARSIDSIVIVLPRPLPRSRWGKALEDVNPAKVVAICPGGKHRAQSVREGLRALDVTGTAADAIVVHDAARPLAAPELADATVRAARRHGAAVAAAMATDTVKHVVRAPVVERTIRREEVFLAQTPQAFRREVLSRVLRNLPRDARRVTDEASLVEERRPLGARVAVVPATRHNVKITEPRDLHVARALLGRPPMLRIGHGFDLHRLVPRRRLRLGGVHIPSKVGLLGHSDGDVLLHALADAIFGAAGQPDLGSLFSDQDSTWRDADSAAFVAEARRRARRAGLSVVNADLVLHAERPRIAPYYKAIRRSVAELLGISVSRVGMKAKTHERLGVVGEGRAMAATAVVLLGEAP